MHPIEQNNIQKFDLSENDFENFGIAVLAYIKPVTMNDKKLFALKSADGKIISLAADEDLALRNAQEKNLIPVFVH